MSETVQILEGDCLSPMKAMPDNSVDLVFCSPPYEAARTYGIGFKLRGQDWVDWALERYVECCRVCKGLVAWVIEGQTRKFQWSATPALLMADLHRRGVKLRKPPLYRRDGIPGSGGPDYLKNVYEFIVTASKGKLPWSDNTVMGHLTKYDEGGPSTNRLADGHRVGYVTMAQKADYGSHRAQRKAGRKYAKPKNGIANPGNIIDCGSGGHIGSPLAHENEAPFPEMLAEFFIRSFCPPNGIVLDCFSGSGTTAAVALKNGRRAIAIDLRQSQVELTCRRIKQIDPLFHTGESHA
jgi:DNA modification methylase